MKAAFMPRSRAFVGRLSPVARRLCDLRPERRSGCAEAPVPVGSGGSLLTGAVLRAGLLPAEPKGWEMPPENCLDQSVCSFDE